MKKHSKQAMLALRAIRRATEKVVHDAINNKYKIPIWKDQRIYFENPEIIAEQLNSTDSKVAADS